jgi:phosphatidylserine decarboxylase
MSKITLVKLLLYILPKSLMSATFGMIASSNVPVFKNMVLYVFCKLYQIDLEESTQNHYENLAALFTRRLKPSARIIAQSEIVSPVDGVISQMGALTQGRLIQAKNRNYSLSQLLQSEEKAEEFIDGFFVTVYLAPHNYHRIHSPVKGEIVGATYVPGAFFPVNNLSVQAIEDLFCRNERVITYIKTEQGIVAVVKVAATNVGCISLTWHPEWRSHSAILERKIQHYTPESPIFVEKGSELGCFELGSTVIMICSAAHDSALLSNSKELKNHVVKMGQSFYSTME